MSSLIAALCHNLDIAYAQQAKPPLSGMDQLRSQSKALCLFRNSDQTNGIPDASDVTHGLVFMLRDEYRVGPTVIAATSPDPGRIEVIAALAVKSPVLVKTTIAVTAARDRLQCREIPRLKRTYRRCGLLDGAGLPSKRDSSID